VLTKQKRRTFILELDEEKKKKKKERAEKKRGELTYE